MLNLSGKTVLITGASQGIGEAAAKTFMQAGANVMMTARNLDKLEKIKKELGDRTEYLAGDISDSSFASGLVDFCYDHFGALDILINNAGTIQPIGLIHEIKPEEWSNVIDVNLNSSFYLLKYFVKKMVKKRFGRIVFISSVVAHTGNPGQVNYTSSKAAISGMVKSLALELSSRNIGVNAVAPGFIASNMTDKLNENQKNSILERIPMKRL